MNTFVGSLRLLAVLFASLSSSLSASTAAACDVISPPALKTEANPRDQTAPSTPTVSAHIDRGHGDNSGDCSGNGFVVLQLSATDDVSAGADLGFLVESDEEELFGGGAPLLAGSTGRLALLYSTSDSGDDDLSFTLRVYSVDKAGNTSREPATVTVRSEGDGCQLAGTPAGGLWSLALLALLFARRRLPGFGR